MRYGHSWEGVASGLVFVHRVLPVNLSFRLSSFVCYDTRHDGEGQCSLSLCFTALHCAELC